MLVLIAAAIFLFCVAVSIAEAIFERDWPRDTFRNVVIFGVLLLLAVFDP